MTDKELLEKIKANDDAWIRYFYDNWKGGFVSWLGKQLNIDNDNAGEIFQITMVTFYENMISGKVESFSSSLKTYFFAIGKNKAFDFLKAKKKRAGLSIDQYIIYNGLVDDNDSHEKHEASLQLIHELLNELGEPCYPLLQLFYFQKLSWGLIAEKLGYKNENSAKNMKYKCILKMKDIIKLKQIEIRF